MRDMVAGAGDLDEPQIPLDHNDFGSRGDRRQTETRGDLALTYLAGTREARLFGMLNDQQVERPGVSEHATHYERIRDRLRAIGESQRAIRGEQPHLREIAAFQPL